MTSIGRSPIQEADEEDKQTGDRFCLIRTSKYGKVSMLDEWHKPCLARIVKRRGAGNCPFSSGSGSCIM